MNYRDESGSALVLALIFVAVWSVAIGAVLLFAGTGFEVAGSAREQREVVFAADAGAEAAINFLARGGTPSGCPNLAYPGAGSGVQVTVSCSEFTPTPVDCRFPYPECPPDCDFEPGHEDCQPPPDCDLEPGHPDCPSYCDLNPDDLVCSPYCDLNPGDPVCSSDYCDLNPGDPVCSSDYCDLNQGEPICSSYCDLDPEHPECPPDCVTNPEDPRCPPDCDLEPEHVECLPEAYSVFYAMTVTVEGRATEIRLLLEFPAGDPLDPEAEPVAEVTVIKWTADRS